MGKFVLSIFYFVMVLVVALAASMDASVYSQGAIISSIMSAGVVIYVVIIAWDSISKKLVMLLDDKDSKEKESEEKADK